MSKQGSNSELFAHENDALTARPQLHIHNPVFPGSNPGCGKVDSAFHHCSLITLNCYFFLNEKIDISPEIGNDLKTKDLYSEYQPCFGGNNGQVPVFLVKNYVLSEIFISKALPELHLLLC